MDDTVTRNEGKAVKRLLHSKDNKRPDGGKDFHMKGGSSIDRWASAVIMRVQPARRFKLHDDDHVTHAPAVECSHASVAAVVKGWLCRDSMCTGAFVQLIGQLDTALIRGVAPRRSKSGQLLDGALTAGSVQHTAHKERLAVDVPKCEACPAVVALRTTHLHPSVTD